MEQKTWNQFVAQYERRKPRQPLPAVRRIENRKSFGVACPLWKDRLEVTQEIKDERLRYQTQLLIQRDYLLDLREMHPDRREEIASFLRTMPKFATKTLGSLS